MDFLMTYNVPHQYSLQYYIAIYFYLTGLSAGSFVISVMAYLLGKTELKPLGKIGAFLAPILLLIAPTLLIIDLGKPLRFWYLFFNVNPTSVLTYGSYLLTLYPISCLIYLYFVIKGDQKMIKTFGLIGIPFAISVHGYTGFVLALSKFSPLWSNAMMPLLFLVSAMVSGIGLVNLIAIGLEKIFNISVAKWGAAGAEVAATQENDRVGLIDMLETVGKYLAGFIILDMFMIFSEILVLKNESEEARAIANNILSGDWAFWFLGVEVLLGAIIPLFILLSKKTNRNLVAQTLASVLVMTGVLAMRFVVIMGGQSVPLN